VTSPVIYALGSVTRLISLWVIALKPIESRCCAVCAEASTLLLEAR